ncbi:uncharacterized protein LOC141595975 [Silene latifolia]|uniref:uncharacterized protein LOC141595975 n=1 Tax=Silene latifolia TaxID=37657 RepID=UPI003D787355
MSSEITASEMAVVDIVSIESTTVVTKSSLAVEDDAVNKEHQGSTNTDRNADQQIFTVPKEDDPDVDHSTNSTSPSPTRTVPSLDPPPDVESGDVTKYSSDLFRAALNGDWGTVMMVAEQAPAWLRTGITEGGETVLHIAAAAKHLKVVEVVITSDPSSLIYTNSDGSTPYCFAAVSGNVEIAETMRLQNYELPYIRGKEGMTPLHMAVLLGHRTMVWYLLSVTDDRRLTTQDRIEILTSSIDNDLLDVALHILKNNTYLAFLEDARGETALHALARKPLKQDEYHQPGIWRIFSNCCGSTGEETKETLQLTKILWNQIIQQKKEDISATIRKPWRLLFVAARLGKVEFLKVLIQAYPDLIWKVDENGYSIFHIAVIHRQVEIFKLIYEIGAIKDLIATYKDTNENNMLHLASRLAPINRLSCVSGAPLQMQRELQWFEAVKQIVRYEYTEAENMDNKTPQALFSEAHETLRKQGEEWMKKTAESCALVAALIATMVFSAAFQLPGGLNNDTGSPVLLKNTAFVFFTMSNAVSLFTSTASILMFLSILTSRYSQKDFLISLPQKLMIGLMLLLISIATMLAGFTSTFFITYQESLRWPPITVAVLASVPVTLFGLQQFPLLVEMYYSTHKFQNLFLPGQQKLFQVPPSESSGLTWQKPDTSRYPFRGRPVHNNLKGYLPPKQHLTDADIVRVPNMLRNIDM